MSLDSSPHQVAAKFVELLLHEGLLFAHLCVDVGGCFSVSHSEFSLRSLGFLLGLYRPARTLPTR